MEIKKSPKADLENKRGLLLEIGLVLALGIVIAIFGYGQRDRGIKEIEVSRTVVDTEPIAITREEVKPPEPIRQTVAVVSDIINVVRNNTPISDNIEFTGYEEGGIPVPIPPPKEEKEADDVPFVTVENMPQFQGGDLNSFRSWVQGRLKYPVIAAENGIQGRVTIEFVIERDGSLTGVKVLASPDPTLSEEATRVLATSPKWTPGKQRNQAVRVRYTLPVDFRIQN